MLVNNILWISMIVKSKVVQMVIGHLTSVQRIIIERNADAFWIIIFNSDFDESNNDDTISGNKPYLSFEAMTLLIPLMVGNHRDVLNDFNQQMCRAVQINLSLPVEEVFKVNSPMRKWLSSIGYSKNFGSQWLHIPVSFVHVMSSFTRILKISCNLRRNCVDTMSSHSVMFLVKC